MNQKTLIIAGVALLAGVVLTNMGFAVKIPVVGTLGMSDDLKKLLKLV